MTLPQKYLLVIIGVGPSGLATAACLREQGVPFVVLERAECIASLWQKRTYDRLKLHLPKQFCHLPKMPFPEEFPEYPTRRQFIDYLESYANHFDINPKFNECVQSARYDETSGFWRVKTVSSSGSTRTELEYLCRWLIVATGENAGCVMPEIEGLGDFGGIPVMVRRQTSHPLDPLSPAEISVAVATVKAAEATPEAVNCRKDLLLRTLVLFSPTLYYVHAQGLLTNRWFFLFQVRDSMRFIEVVLQELGKHVVALADAYFFPPFQPSLVPRNKGGAHIPSKLPARRARLVVYNKKSNETSVWIVELSKVHAVTQGGHRRGKVISSQVVPDVQPPMVCWHAIFAYLA